MKVEAVGFEQPPRRSRYNGTIARPRVIIPVFPGTNCEYDSARAFEQAGAVADTLVINNLTPADVAESTEALVEAIKNSQIIMLPGGFSGGDEPDGSGEVHHGLLPRPRGHARRCATCCRTATA